MVDEEKKRMMNIINYFINIIIMYVMSNKDTPNSEIGEIFLLPDECIQLIKDEKFEDFVKVLYWSIPSIEDCTNEATKIITEDKRIIH